MYTDKIVTNSEFEIPQGLEGEQVLEYVKPLVWEAWKAAKDNIFAVGRWLNAAKQRCDHGEFGAFCKAELPFSQSTAEKLMKIAKSEVLNEPEVYEKLPASWGTLSSLAAFATKNPFDVRAAAADGRIKETMTKAEVEALKKASDTPSAAPSRTAFEETNSGYGDNLSAALLEGVLVPAMVAVSQYADAEDAYDQETFNTIFDALLQLRIVAAKLDGEFEDKYEKNLLLNFARNMEEDDFYAIYSRMGKWMSEGSLIAA